MPRTFCWLSTADLVQWEAATSELNIDASLPSAPTTQFSKDGQRTLDSFQTIASLIVTSAEFRALASDAVLVLRDILADAVALIAEQADSAASTIRPSKAEREQGVDLDSAQQKGKQVVKDVKKGKVQKNARDELYDDMEKVKEYLDDKLPAGDEAKDAVIKRFQQVGPQLDPGPLC